jgi:nitrogenase molybdenum-iron protein NifN
MTRISGNGKSVTVNPARSSAPLGGAMAFLGVDRCLPLFHGSQGCAAFALVLMVRHFREAIPLQTTAMGELNAILGGADNIEEAIGNIRDRAAPRLIGICSTALTETRGEDAFGDLALMRERHPDWSDMSLVLASTPDYAGGLQEGWAKAVEAMIAELVPQGPADPSPIQVNLLPGSHLTPGDVEELRETVSAFGLDPIVLPDLSGSLDGHVPVEYVPTTLGGTPVDDIPYMRASAVTLAIGEQMRPAAELLERRTGVPVQVFDRLTGLKSVDTFLTALSGISGRPVPARFRRQRSQLIDAMLDGHFYFAGRHIAIAADPDLLLSFSGFLVDMGCTIQAAVSTTSSPALERVPADAVVIGDLDDLEQAAAGCDLIVAHSHGRQAAQRTGIPLYRTGFPVFDQLGVANRVTVGYRGTRDLIFRVGNILIEGHDGHDGPAHGHEERAHDGIVDAPLAAD